MTGALGIGSSHTLPCHLGRDNCGSCMVMHFEDSDFSSRLWCFFFWGGKVIGEVAVKKNEGGKFSMSLPSNGWVTVDTHHVFFI